MDRGTETGRINPALLVDRLIGPEPDPVPCPFCGRPLRYMDIGSTEDGHIWSMLPENCTCEAYLQHLEQVAAENRRWEAAEKHRRIDTMYDCLIGETLYGSGFGGRGQYTFDAYQPGTPEQRDALYRVRCYVREYAEMLESGTGMLLCGNNGTGKTHLAIACLQALQRAGHHGLMFRSAPQMTSELRSAWDRKISETALLHAYTMVPLLVMDDIGKQSRSDYVQRYLFEILDSRYSHRLPTILTTNASPKTLPHCIGPDTDVTDALVSRLMETVLCIAVRGPDHRKRHRACVTRRPDNAVSA